MEIQQEKIEIVDEKIKICAFTGHRDLGADFQVNLLEKEIENLINLGVDTFLTGMAIGFDLICAETVLSLKEKYKNIKLVACVPFYNQEKSYTEKDKERYAKILSLVDENILLSERYFRGCLHVRNKFMADKADVMVAYLKKDTGGTAWTVKYFQKKYPFSKIVFL